MEMADALQNAEDGYEVVLGTTFIRQFTGSFNSDTRMVSLAPSITSEAGSSIEPIGPSPPDPHGGGDGNLTLWEIFAIAAGGFLLLIIIIAICVYCITKKRSDQDENIDEMRE